MRNRRSEIGTKRKSGDLVKQEKALADRADATQFLAEQQGDLLRA